MSNPGDEHGMNQMVSGPWWGIIVLALVLILGLELILSIRRETQTWDEACHMFAGYSYWTRGDFGINPEHPPLVKLLATLPLLGMSLQVPPHAKVFSKEEDFLTSKQFVYSNDADKILFRSRVSAAALTLLLAVLVFAAAKEMFGSTPALIALVIFILEPTILAHGALVTTDMGLSCLLFATVYTLYRYLKQPSPLRLGLTALMAGLALAAKHSGILLVPILLSLTICEIGLHYIRARNTRSKLDSTKRLLKRAVRLASALIAIGAISIVLLWASYGFRLQPRPEFDAQSQVVGYAARLKHATQAKLISGFARSHLLPEAYLYGLTDVGVTAEFSRTYLLGTIYPHGKWFYFPLAFAIKSTITLLLLFLLVPIMIAVRRVICWRELLFMAVPALVYVVIAMTSGMNIGIRHILPVYPFLIVLAGWAAWQLIRNRRHWAYAIGVLLLFDIISSVRTFPVYLAYSNEFWGGPANTYKYLTDSNVDWGQQLKAAKKYLDSRHVDHCWFAYFARRWLTRLTMGFPANRSRRLLLCGCSHRLMFRRASMAQS